MYYYTSFVVLVHYLPTTKKVQGFSTTVLLIFLLLECNSNSRVCSWATELM
jgi:hypothetical protein